MVLSLSYSIPRFQYEETMPCEQLVSFVCDIKQAYTQYGGKRPFGVSILYMGWDKELGYQLYQSDPSGIEKDKYNVFCRYSACSA